MSTAPTFHDALGRLRNLFAIYHQSPGMAIHSLELEDRTRAAALAGLAARVSFAAVCAELGRVAVESFPNDQVAALGLGRTMTWWAAQAYGRRAAS